MIFAKVDVDLSDHMKAFEAGPAMGTWLWGLLYSRKHELDGHLPTAALRLAWVGEEVAKQHSEELVRVGLWKRSRSGLVIQNYAKKNQTKSDIDQRREDARERMQRVRANKIARSREPTANALSAVPVSVSVSVSDSVSLSEGEPERVRPAHERYAEAYAAGQLYAGAEAYPAPGPSQHGALAEMTAWAKGTDGKPLRAEALEAWFLSASREYRTQWRDHAQYTAGFSPRKCVEWLKTGRQPPRANAAQALRQLPPETGSIWKVGTDG